MAVRPGREPGDEGVELAGTAAGTARAPGEVAGAGEMADEWRVGDVYVAIWGYRKVGGTVREPAPAERADEGECGAELLNAVAELARQYLNLGTGDKSQNETTSTSK